MDWSVFSSLGRFRFLLLSRSFPACSFGTGSTFVPTTLFILCIASLWVRRFLYIYYTWETLLIVFLRTFGRRRPPNSTNWKLAQILIEIILKWWCGPFALSLILSPPLALITKKRRTREPFTILPLWGLTLSPPLVKEIWVKGHTNWELHEQRQRVNDTLRLGVEALSLPNTSFPFQFKTNHKNTLESTLVLAFAQEE
jgi:hypothetical protein